MPKLWPSLSQRLLHAPGGADERAAVRRVGDRAVDDVLDAAVGERRHAPLRRLDMRQQSLQVAFEQALAEPIGHTVGKSRRALRPRRARDPAHALLAQIIRFVRLTQHREFAAAALAVGLQFRRLVVNDVLMLDRDRGHVDAEQAPRLPRVVAGRANHVLGNDVALVGGQTAIRRTRVRLTRGDLGLLVDFRAAARAPLRSAMVRSAGAMWPSSG